MASPEADALAGVFRSFGEDWMANEIITDHAEASGPGCSHHDART